MVPCIHMLFKSIFDVNIFNCIFVPRYISGYYCFILECMVGYSGYNCNILCDGCLSDTCDSEYGICADLSGCKPGWQHMQPKCDLGILIER